MKYKPMLLLAALLLGVADVASAGDRVDHRLDRRGDGIENRYDQHANQAHNHGYGHLPNRLEAHGNRFDHRWDRRR